MIKSICYSNFRFLNSIRARNIIKRNHSWKQPAYKRKFSTVNFNAHSRPPKCNSNTFKTIVKNKDSLSITGALFEFLHHPQTYEKNNGFFNILFVLALCGYCCYVCGFEETASADKNRKATFEKSRTTIDKSIK